MGFLVPHKSTDELTIRLRGNRVCVVSFSGEELPCILKVVDTGRFDINSPNPASDNFDR
ncbi:MAG: hypothetical protein ABSF15_28100 [Candidatus Sulfotelmatobacter sp.]|jgi:hypothetical protein